jgi:hypothetical protein
VLRATTARAIVLDVLDVPPVRSWSSIWYGSSAWPAAGSVGDCGELVVMREAGTIVTETTGRGSGEAQ